MKRCISGQARTKRYGSTPKTWAVCSVSKKKAATTRNPQSTIPNGVRHHGVFACSSIWSYSRDAAVRSRDLHHAHHHAHRAHQLVRRPLLLVAEGGVERLDRRLDLPH